MLKISTKSQYGLRAMAFLAKSPKAVFTLNEISRNEGIPKDYLEKILSKLVKRGMVEAKKGAGGGYALKVSAKSIKVGEILNILEGNSPIVKCLDVKGCNCPRERNCVTRNVWAKLQLSLDNTLNRIRLMDLIKQ